MGVEAGLTNRFDLYRPLHKPMTAPSPASQRRTAAGRCAPYFFGAGLLISPRRMALSAEARMASRPEM